MENPEKGNVLQRKEEEKNQKMTTGIHEKEDEENINILETNFG